MKRILLASLVGTFTFLCWPAQMSMAAAKEVDVAVGAPVHCGTTAISCGEDITLDRAEKIAQIALKLEPEVESYAPCDQTGSDGEYVWAKPDDISGGTKALAQLLADAKSGKVFDQHQIVEALPRKPGEQHLALCRVSEQQGPPRECITVALITHNETLLRALRPEFPKQYPYGGCPEAAIYRVTASINIEYNIISNLSPAVFVSALRDELINRQHLMPEIRVSNDSDGVIFGAFLTSATPLRDSTVLSAGWRESYDFDVDILRDNDIRDKLSVTGTLRPMVSRQAVGTLTAFQGPDDAQRSRYATFFDTLVGDAIKSACKHPIQNDAKTITCK